MQASHAKSVRMIRATHTTLLPLEVKGNRVGTRQTVEENKGMIIRVAYPMKAEAEEAAQENGHEWNLRPEQANREHRNRRRSIHLADGPEEFWGCLAAICTHRWQLSNHCGAM
jgi:hypothetical protein